MVKATVTHTTIILARPEVVWDYTQNWKHRKEWDKGVSTVTDLSTQENKKLRVSFMGGLAFNIEYKLNDRPRKTSLAMTQSNSKWITGGGGSWRYEVVSGGTEWTQVNTLVLADSLLMRLLRPIFEISLKFSTMRAMRAAKKIIEGAR